MRFIFCTAYYTAFYKKIKLLTIYIPPFRKCDCTKYHKGKNAETQSSGLMNLQGFK